jgi:hypothetical protein
LRRATRPLPRLAALSFLLAIGMAAAGPSQAAAAPPPPREKLTAKPSGFWTSSRPAKGGAYRYRMLGIGAGLAILTAFVTFRVIRRHGGEGKPRPIAGQRPQP